MSWSASRLIRAALPYLNWDKYSPQAMPVRCRRTSFCQLQCKFNIDNNLTTDLRNGFINVARLLDAIGSRQAAIKNLGNAANDIYIVSAFRLFFPRLSPPLTRNASVRTGRRASSATAVSISILDIHINTFLICLTL